MIMQEKLNKYYDKQSIVPTQQQYNTYYDKQAKIDRYVSRETLLPLSWELFHVKHMDKYKHKKWTDKPKGLSVHIPDLNKYETTH